MPGHMRMVQMRGHMEGNVKIRANCATKDILNHI